MAADLTGQENGDVHIQAQVAVLSERTRTHGATIERHEGSIDRIYSRLGKIERLIWIGIGGGLALTSVASFFGWNILKMLGK